MSEEVDRLEDVADWYETEGFYARFVETGFKIIKHHFKRERCLELGCADGAMTEKLLDQFESVVAVDGAEKHCRQVRQRLNDENLTVVCELFEDYQPDYRFDTIIMAHVLEHVKDPVALLERVGSWLRDDGRIIAIVPNGNSLHRQVAVEMGLLERPNEIDDHDEDLGHRRVYMPDEFENHIRKAGLDISDAGGIGLKPLTNQQMDDYLNEDIQNAYLSLGEHHPHIAAERYAVAIPPTVNSDR